MVKMGAVWDRTIEFIGANTGAVVTIALAAIFAPSVIVESLQLALTGGDQTASNPLGGILALIAAILSLLGQVAIVALALDPRLGSGGAFSVAGRRLLPVIGVSIVFGLLFLVLFVPVLIAIFSANIDFTAAMAGQTPDIGAGTLAFIGLYSLAMVPLLFWISARFSVLLPTIVQERRGLGAIPRAFSLTRSHALRIIGVYVLFIIVVGVAMLAAIGVFGTVFNMVAGNENPVNVATVLTSVVVGLVTTAVTVLYTTFLTKLYTLLVDEREPAAVFE